MKRCTFLVIAVLLVFVPWRQSVRADAAHYAIENLGLVGGTLMPTITGVNAAGQVSGYVSTPSGDFRAVRYTNGVGWQYLPGLDANSVAYGINAAGDLVGSHNAPGGPSRAFRYRDASGVQDIAPLSGGSENFGFAINDNGDVVGYSIIDAPFSYVAFRAVSGSPAVALPSLGGDFTVACAVNDAGQVAGYSLVAGNAQQHAFRVDPGQPLSVDIGSFDGPDGLSGGCAIDAAGRVGGEASNGGIRQAFRFADDTLLNLDTFGSTGSKTESIADGTSVGWFTLPDGSLHAFVHTDANGTIDLNTLVDAASGWALSQALGVNTAGVVVGAGTVNGQATIFRLTPVTVPVDTTPPSIMAVSASPSVITPPNRTMVPVVVSVTAFDDQDPSPVCTISGIDAHWAGSTAATITGPLTGSVMALAGATYSFAVRCTDNAGNASNGGVNVTVPPDTTAPVFTSLTATPSVITPPKGQTVTVTVAITATDDSGVAPVCKLGNITGPGSAPADFNVTGANTGTVRAIGGRTYAFNALCVDGSNNVRWSSVNVIVPPDTTAPVITSLVASPSVIWPPTGLLTPVSLTVSATDDVDDAPVCVLTSITSSGTTADDFGITGPLTARVRATGGRTYTLNVRCSDRAGNSSAAAAAVFVQPDTTAPRVSAISATPSFIWPPNGKFVPVSVSVTATDDVDAAPVCSLQSVTGAPNTAFIVTGALTASVRAERNGDGSNRVYSLNVSCVDRAGNAATAVAAVTVTKDPVQPVKGFEKK